MKTGLWRIVVVGFALLIMESPLLAFSLDFDGDEDVDAGDLSVLSGKIARNEAAAGELELFALRFAMMYSTFRTQVRPTIAAWGTDGGSEQDWVVDGTFDAINVCDHFDKKVIVTRYQSFDYTQDFETRGLYEFQIPAALDDPTVTVSAAELFLNTFDRPSGWRSMSIHAYMGDGFANLADLEVDNPIATVSVGNYDLSVDVSDYIRSIADAADYAGFTIRSGPLVYSNQNYAKFHNGLPHPVFGDVSGQLAYLEIKYDDWQTR